MRGLIAIALLASSAATADSGALYGTLVLDQGREVSGALRWDDEELYWLDHFNATHEEAHDLSGLPDADQQRILDHQPGPQLRLGNRVIELVKWFSEDGLRPADFALEFGALAALEIESRSRLTIVLRDGSRIEADGSQSNDVGRSVLLRDAAGDEHEYGWREISRIQFAPMPDGHPQFPSQLYGRITTSSGVLEGLVEWDRDERHGSDKLDGELPSGEDLALPFSRIASIENQGEQSLVTTSDGDQLIMSDTNDVNSQNRGIVVTSPRFGRATISWSEFKRAEFSPLPADFLPSQDTWSQIGELKGRVLTIEGQSVEGVLVFDVDERWQAEMLDGVAEGIRYELPLRLVRAIERIDQGVRATLVGGTALDLAADSDVSSSNNGVIVIGSEGPRYLAWAEVASIRLD